MKPYSVFFFVDSEHGKCLEAVNAVRKVAGLDLPEFTAPKALKSLRVGRGTGGTDYEKALYNLTCKEIEGATIDPTVRLRTVNSARCTSCHRSILSN